MSDIRAIVRKITQDLSPQFEARLREQLNAHSKEWLIDQIVRLSLDVHSLAEADHRRVQEANARECADNVIMEVEFGEIEGELIGAGIVQTLSLINNLEVTEQILYARMINVEQTTLYLK